MLAISFIYVTEVTNVGDLNTCYLYSSIIYLLITITLRFCIKKKNSTLKSLATSRLRARLHQESLQTRGRMHQQRGRWADNMAQRSHDQVLSEHPQRLVTSSRSIVHPISKHLLKRTSMEKLLSSLSRPRQSVHRIMRLWWLVPPRKRGVRTILSVISPI